MMDNKTKFIKTKKMQGILLICAGVILVFPALILNQQMSLQVYLKLAKGLGLFLILWGIWTLFRTRSYLRNPAVLNQDSIQSTDERSSWIRYRAGSNAFYTGAGLTYLALLVIGVTNKPIDPNLAWWALAGIVVATLLMYIISLVVYEGKY